MDSMGDIEAWAEGVIEFDEVVVSDSIIQQGLGTEQRLVLEVGSDCQGREFRKDWLVDEARDVEKRSNSPDVPGMQYY